MLLPVVYSWKFNNELMPGEINLNNLLFYIFFATTDPKNS